MDIDREKEGKCLTVTVPCYNSESYLERCVESLLKERDGLEIILVDDNADANWAEKVAAIAEKFQKKYEIPFRYLVNEKNLGSAASRNRGIAEASGAYITFLDDDDRYEKDKVECQVRHMKRLDASGC